ncbi:MAG: serine O-acetyltransferase [Cyanobacteria bacterium P01_F01_bin.4]
MLKSLFADFKIIFDRDPAARNWLEVLFCYPGLQALLMHRVAHRLWHLGLPFVPRLISHLARFFTGIEIHPGATIGQGVFIDHGMGVVIGETAIIGDDVLIYQGVTLGGTGKESGKRHPTLGNHVVVGAGAKVLGNIQIGNNVRIGAGSVVLREVPSDCTVVGVPGRVVYRSGERVEPLEHGRLPDSEAEVIRTLVDRIENLEQQLEAMRSAQSDRVLAAVGASANNANNMVAGNMAASNMPASSADANGHTDFNGIPHKDCCRLEDRAIEEFLGGAGEDFLGGSGM